MKWFLADEHSIPAELGFTMFGRAHLTALFLILLCCIILLRKIRKMREGEYLRLFRILSSSMIVLELIKELVMALAGTYSIGYLPLHLCSVSMFLCVYAAWHPEQKWCVQVLYSVGFSGALSALLFPDWTSFPIWHFQSLHSFLWHTLLLQCSLMPAVHQNRQLGIRYIWKSLAFLGCAAVPVYLLDRLLRTNYMFLLSASPGSPLELLGSLPGHAGYIAGMFLMVAVVILLMNLPFDIYCRFPVKRKL